MHPDPVVGRFGTMSTKMLIQPVCFQNIEIRSVNARLGLCARHNKERTEAALCSCLLSIPAPLMSTVVSPLSGGLTLTCCFVVRLACSHTDHGNEAQFDSYVTGVRELKKTECSLVGCITNGSTLALRSKMKSKMHC